MFASFQAGGPGNESPRAIRNRIVRRLPRLRRIVDDTLQVLVDPDAHGVRFEMLSGAATYVSLLWELIDEFTATYVEVLPRVSVARCPFTGEIARLAIDTYGIDGPWWNAATPLRAADARPSTLVCVAGALRLNGAAEVTAHAVEPGPGVPWVSPRLLALDGVQAVVQSIEVGPHLGWTIAYFSEVPGVPPLPEWGMGTPAGESRDTDLAPWIERGRLAWIAPGDETLTLRRDLEGCPYVGLPGERGLQRIEGGAVRVLD